MRLKHSCHAAGARHPVFSALICGLCLLAPAGALALGPPADAKELTYVEYSHNLVAAYPEALGRRVRQMQRRASTPLSAVETCRRAVDGVPGDLEDNPNRRIALVAIGPIGRPPDAWERQALARLSTGDERAVHAFVDMPVDTGGATREVFRYIEPLDGLPEPCGALLEDAEAGPALSLLRLDGATRGGTSTLEFGKPAPELPMPFPPRQGQRQ